MLQKYVIHGLDNDLWTVESMKQLKSRGANFEWLAFDHILNEGKTKKGKNKHNYLAGIESFKTIISKSEPNYGKEF